ncbi:peroxiredoxin [Monocercomonoides exilis]|uniref:peroxiredoxin n=1 Tax=Monocercomonoides exilis TaxID=2049356 RepID=UPI003559E374|nr:peroxiredoxin [Monocercomonoides exilis]|eukprot:MONOS_6182.1-p1 / transcript=MONOS_6182.1 / gene=MONOS_6182 / organism=Monocercomonoides_exilis_PA203 / gene_product=peroxiredoxin / transcript_product=peroxiredoxin / location=Mono_scaffold00191:61140-61643(-) / protein_length=168 / sequence_SO=supercontig / SO=protein_coding / is_pseudo=false
MEVKIGEKPSDFSLPDAEGNPISFYSKLGKGPVVVFFYPKDDSHVCTKEACSFRDNYVKFCDYGAVVIGISSDSVESHRKFIEKYKLNFILLSDLEGKIRKQWKVPRALFLPGRVTYVFDKDGICRYKHEGVMQDIAHVEGALDIVKNISSSSSKIEEATSSSSTPS